MHEIRGLYANEVVYINWHLRKEHNRKIKEAKQFRNPMFIGAYAGGLRPEYMGYQGRPQRFDQQPGGPSGPRGAGFQGGYQRPYVPRGPGYQGGAPRGGVLAKPLNKF